MCHCTHLLHTVTSFRCIRLAAAKPRFVSTSESKVFRFSNIFQIEIFAREIVGARVEFIVNYCLSFLWDGFIREEEGEEHEEEKKKYIYI